MFEQFKARAVGVGAEVHRFGGKAEALEFLKTFLTQEGVAPQPGSYAVWAPCPFLEGAAQASWGDLPGVKFQVTRELAAQAKVGITQMDYALADTGSLVGDQSGIEQRLASSLTTIHIALVPGARILADKAELFRRMRPADSRYLAFITGPSRTADIERVLTIGVHGPERLVIVFVDDLEGGRA